MDRPDQMAQMSHALSAIAHEIKNPLASLKLNAQMVARAIERGRAPRLESAALLSRAVDELDQIASALSEAARADSGRLALSLKCVDMGALLRRIATEGAEAHGRRIVVEAPQRQGPLLALADSVRIQQVMDYLLANALAYSPTQTPITLAARRVGKRLRVEARDQGPGIAAHDRAYIFEPFYRGAPAPQPSGVIGGAGLGLSLYIARRIVELHGGEIGVDATTGQPGHGTSVWFTLPSATCS
jgi:signal transduction histidine kinase